jgi:hypothetical protein
MTPTSDQLSIDAQGETLHPVSVARKGPHAVACGNLPALNHLVSTAGYDLVSRLGVLHRRQSVVVALGT